MTRSQMIETVARKTGFTEAQVETTMDALFDQIADCLRADEKVTIAGFGRFEMRPRKPKAYTNPKTKVSSRLESTSIPGFKASGRFKQKLEVGKKTAPPTARLRSGLTARAAACASAAMIGEFPLTRYKVCLIARTSGSFAACRTKFTTGSKLI